MDKASNRFADVSTHASVRRRPCRPCRRTAERMCFNSRLREEATITAHSKEAIALVSTHASVRRRLLRRRNA